MAKIVQNGFNSVETKIENLIKILRKNKAIHIEEYNKANKVYEDAKLAFVKEYKIQYENKVEELKRLLDKRVTEVNSIVEKCVQNHEKYEEIIYGCININMQMNLTPDVILQATKPENHEYDYEKVIKMLEISTANFVHLGEQELNWYIFDDWSWKEAFVTNNQNLYYGNGLYNNHTWGVSLASGCTMISSGTSSINPNLIAHT